MNENEIVKLIKENWDEKPSAILKSKVISRVLHDSKSKENLYQRRNKIQLVFTSICVFITLYAYVTDRNQTKTLGSFDKSAAINIRSSANILNSRELIALLDDDYRTNNRREVN